jgi:tripartite-type tricarboxylate transporter receptor subunit TctC
MNVPAMTLAAAAAIIGAFQVQAQSFPDRPLRLIVPYPPGGNTDILARTVSQRLTESLGKPVVVDNRGGGNGVIASEISARSSPDGHTVFVGSTRELSINPAMMRSLPYDAVKDFAPVSQGTITAILLGVHPSLPVKSIKELVAHAKSDPKGMAYGTPGIGTAMHLSGELLNMAAGINTVHVAYKGGGPAVAAVLAGQEVKFGYMGMGPVIPHIKSGKIRPLALTMGKRSALLPDVPTMQESGVADFEVNSWYGVCAPAGVPEALLDKLNADVHAAMRVPEVEHRLTELGMPPAPTTREEFDTFMRAEIARWAQVITDAKIPRQ